MQELKSQLFSHYMSLGTTDEKLRFVLDYGSDFLGVDHWYSGGRHGISLYDALYWERYETKTLDDLLEFLVDDFDEDEEEEEEEAVEATEPFFSLAKNAEEDWLFKAIHTDKPRALVVRDFLDGGIGSATHDW